MSDKKQKCKICLEDKEHIDDLLCIDCRHATYWNDNHKYVISKLISRIEKLERYNQNIAAKVYKLERDETALDISNEKRIEKLENFIPDVLQDFEGRLVMLEQEESK
jgi:hypothetical protein